MDVSILTEMKPDKMIHRGSIGKRYRIFDYTIDIVERLVLFDDVKYKYIISGFGIVLHKGYAPTEIEAMKRACVLMDHYIGTS